MTVNGGGHGWPVPTGIARFDATSVISSWFMSLQGSPQTAASLSAKLVSLTVKSGPPRKILVRLSSTLAAAGKATLALAGKTVYSHRVSVSSGATSVTLVVPAKLRKGTYRLTVSLASAATGGAVTMRRTVHLPR